MRSEKDRAVDFLEMVVAGQIEQAYAKHVDMQGKHHNVYFPPGFTTLKEAMIEDEMAHPGKKLKIKHVLGDGDMVAVHSNLVIKPGEPEMTVVHIFRFKGEKIVEMWDIGQQIPSDSPNTEGAF